MCRSSFSLPRSFPLGSLFFSGSVVQQHNHSPCKAGDGRLLLKQCLLRAGHPAEVLPIRSLGSEMPLQGHLPAHSHSPFSGEL